MFRSVKLVAIASVAILASAQFAHADAAKRTFVDSVRVSYSDLDLRTDAGARVMFSRLEKAAYDVCGGDPRWHPVYKIRPHHVKEVFRECREDALSRAVASVNERALWQVFAAAEARETQRAARDRRG